MEIVSGGEQLQCLCNQTQAFLINSYLLELQTIMCLDDDIHSRFELLKLW